VGEPGVKRGRVTFPGAWIRKGTRYLPPVTSGDISREDVLPTLDTLIGVATRRPGLLYQATHKQGAKRARYLLGVCEVIGRTASANFTLTHEFTPWDPDEDAFRVVVLVLVDQYHMEHLSGRAPQHWVDVLSWYRNTTAW
jgi:hypothetical protein